jgi:O-antigen ligase
VTSLKPLQWAGWALGATLVVYAVFSHLQYFSNVSFLSAILLLEVIIASLCKYDQFFLVLLITAFLWGGMHVPLQDTWTSGRWVVLSAGALVGLIIWIKAPRGGFRLLHLLAFFCVAAAFVSATVSSLGQMASLKASSLLLLFLYCVAGARLAVLGREERFFHGLLWASEMAVYSTAVCYIGLGQAIWGNPNSLGAALSVGLFPVLLWGWLTTDGPALKFRRVTALLLCVYLIFFSMARAAMVATVVVTLVFCIGLRQYKLLVKVTGLALCLIAMAGMFAPASLNRSLGDVKDAVLYKGHKQEGVLGSRQTPWENSIATIKAHPWFGTGYGTSPTGEDTGVSFGRFASTAETVREHGSSYMMITEWVGLLGVLPFAGLLFLTLSNVWRVCVWMRRTSNPRHYSIPLAMIVLSGLVHASFEDWLFAVGYYLCVYFWFVSFVLADFVVATAAVPAPAVLKRASASPSGLGTVALNR